MIDDNLKEINKINDDLESKLLPLLSKINSDFRYDTKKYRLLMDLLYVLTKAKREVSKKLDAHLDQNKKRIKNENKKNGYY